MATEHCRNQNRWGGLLFWRYFAVPWLYR